MDRSPQYGYDWPIASPALTVENFIEFFRHHGFKITTSRQFESEKSKIVIYSNGGIFTHVARYVRDGIWTSKLGEEMDCEHDLLALEGPLYGKVHTYMER